MLIQVHFQITLYHFTGSASTLFKKKSTFLLVPCIIVGIHFTDAYASIYTHMYTYEQVYIVECNATIILNKNIYEIKNKKNKIFYFILIYSFSNGFHFIM